MINMMVCEPFPTGNGSEHAVCFTASRTGRVLTIVRPTLARAQAFHRQWTRHVTTATRRAKKRDERRAKTVARRNARRTAIAG